MADESDAVDALPDPSRRTFLIRSAAATTALFAAPLLPAAARGAGTPDREVGGSSAVHVTLQVNGRRHELRLDPRVTLLDALRDRIGLTGTKKGCDQGACGACTVLVDGRRINSCLTLAVMQDRARIITVEGLALGETLHPLQAAFIRRDAFQCGFCTPGQLCSAVGLLAEGHGQSDGEIREWMSGNLCRCGAYPNILAAIREVAGRENHASL